MTKAPTSTENPKRNVTTQKRHQEFDYTAIAYRLRTVSCINNSPNLCGKTGLQIPNIPNNHKNCEIKRTHI